MRSPDNWFNRNNAVDDIKDFLKRVNADDLRDKIDAFRTLPIQRLSPIETSDNILKVLSVDTPNGGIAVLAPQTGSYPAGTRFYRVRLLQPDDTKLPLRDMRTEDDAWNPPPHLVKLGRINKEGESLLYTAPLNPSEAVEEMKVPDSVMFSLIVYEAVEEIRVSLIGLCPQIPDLTREKP